MGYRDEREAALARAQGLEEQLAEAQAQHRADDALRAQLARDLARANAEIVRLGGTAVPNALVPSSAFNTRVARGAALAAALAAVATLLASVRSERMGVEVAHWAGTALGAWLGAWLARRRSPRACVAAAVAGGVLGFVATVAFFASIWRGL